jgi:hypothetical protein
MSITTSISDFVAGCLSGADIAAYPALAKLRDILLEFRGVQTNAPAVAGEVGEYVSAGIGDGSPVNLSGSVVSSLTSVVLTPGDWDIEAIAILQGAPTGLSQWRAAVATTTGVVGTLGTDASDNAPVAAPSGRVPVTVPRHRILLASTTTYYLNVVAVFTGGSAQAFGRIVARRAR